MTNLRPKYYNMEDWMILDMRQAHMYDENETPFTIMKVKIGTLCVEELRINNTYSEHNFDIIRWITKNEFDRLQQGANTIIW